MEHLAFIHSHMGMQLLRALENPKMKEIFVHFNAPVLGTEPSGPGGSMNLSESPFYILKKDNIEKTVTVEVHNAFIKIIIRGHNHTDLIIPWTSIIYIEVRLQKV